LAPNFHPQYVFPLLCTRRQHVGLAGVTL